jgi:hypothetical protein
VVWIYGVGVWKRKLKISVTGFLGWVEKGDFNAEALRR